MYCPCIENCYERTNRFRRRGNKQTACSYEKTSDFDYEKYGINDKEKDIISLVAQGLSNKEIATELFFE